MSLPDHLLDDDRPEPDDYCEHHAGYLRPCRACRAEAVLVRAEELAEEKRHERRRDAISRVD